MHASISFFVALANPAGIDFFNDLLISVTASKSPGDAIGKPASIGDAKIETIEKAQMNDNTKYVSLGDVSKILGAKF